MIFDFADTLIYNRAPSQRLCYYPFFPVVPGVPWLLRQLKPHFPLAVLSNLFIARDEDVRLALRHTGLIGFFDVVETSESLGYEKPDPRAFRAILDLLRADASEAIMIGDEWEADIVGASNAGMRAIWFMNHRQSPPSPLSNLLLISDNPYRIAHSLGKG